MPEAKVYIAFSALNSCSFHTESDASSDAAIRLTKKKNNKKKTNRTLYVLMICSHCRVAARESTIAAIIARIGHLSNLTTHIQI